MRQQVLGALDLAIDFATLGEYGLEPLPATAGGSADGPCRERPGPATGWEAFAKARRGACTFELPPALRRPRIARAY